MPGNTASIKRRFLLLFVALLFNQLTGLVASSSIQDYRYQKAFKVQHLSLSDGLSQSVVNSVIQDSDGYIWLATEDGLNRFDSYEFKTFRHDHRKDDSLHENWVISLIEEPGYGIWVGTVSGLSFFDPKQQSFTDYSIFNGDLKTYIWSFIYDQNSVVWIATDNGLFYVDRANNQVVPFIDSSGKELDDEVTSLTDSDDYIYAATSNCIYRIEKKSNHRVNLCDNPELNILNNSVLKIIKIQGELLWIGTANGLFRYNLQSNILTAYINQKEKINSISDNQINDLVIDKNSSLWIATSKGLNLYNKDKEIFERYSQQTFAQDGLSSNDIFSLYVDEHDLIWLGTYGGGVNILDPNQHQFEHLLTRTDVIEIGNNNTIHGVEKDQYENLWLASYGGGLINYDLLTGKISRPLNDAKVDYDEHVYSLLIDHSNRLWVGTLRDLEIIDVKSKISIDTLFLLDGQIIDRIGHVMRLHEDHQGSVWIGSENGLFKVTGTQYKNKKLHIELTDLTHKLPNSFSNFSSNISSIIDDQYGNFWFGGYAGLVFYDVEQDEWQHYRYDKSNPQSLSNDSVQVIYEDSQGFLWVGTADGLNRVNRSEFDKDTFYFERITTYEGLPNNAIYGILEDQDQQLWISTTRGLVKYIHNMVNMDVFGSIDGLSSDEFNTGAYFSDSEGKLYFGSVNGITIVNHAADRSVAKKAKVLFSQVKVGNRNIDTYQLNHTDNPTITQQSNEASIDISVVNINFDRLGTQRYRYRILGLDNQWNYLGVTRKLFIAGLSEGHYQLDIESKLAGQLWNQMQRLNIQVNSSFWKSSEAYFLIAFSILMFFLSSLFLVARFYKAQVNKVNKKMGVELLRTKEIRADNDALKFELQTKESEVNSLNKKIKSDEHKLSVEKYRDAITGFYRLNYLEQINQEELIENQDAESSSFSCYNSLVVFELSDYSEVEKNLGPLAAAELAAKVSINIRQKTDSQTQIFCVKNGIFLLLNSQVDSHAFRDSIINLRHHIVRSQFDVANSQSTHTRISLTVMDISQADINAKEELMTMVELIIASHIFLARKNKHSNIQLQITKSAKHFTQINIKENIAGLLDNNKLIFSPL